MRRHATPRCSLSSVRNEIAVADSARERSVSALLRVDQKHVRTAIPHTQSNRIGTSHNTRTTNNNNNNNKTSPRVIPVLRIPRRTGMTPSDGAGVPPMRRPRVGYGARIGDLCESEIPPTRCDDSVFALVNIRGSTPWTGARLGVPHGFREYHCGNTPCETLVS